jgi:hypothetical protein
VALGVGDHSGLDLEAPGLHRNLVPKTPVDTSKTSRQPQVEMVLRSSALIVGDRGQKRSSDCALDSPVARIAYFSRSRLQQLSSQAQRPILRCSDCSGSHYARGGSKWHDRSADAATIEDIAGGPPCERALRDHRPAILSDVHRSHSVKEYAC